VQPGCAFRQATVSRLGEAELPLDDAERMLDPGAQAGQLTIEFALFPRPWPMLSSDVRPHFWLGRIKRSVGFVVPRIAEHDLLVAMKQALQLGDVGRIDRQLGDVGGIDSGTDDAINEAALTVNADVPLHSEVPLIAF